MHMLCETVKRRNRVERNCNGRQVCKATASTGDTSDRQDFVRELTATTRRTRVAWT